jgi:HicB family
MRTSNFALRLQPTLMEEAKAMAKAEGVALNQLINVALAEKLAATRTREFFERYTRDADVAKARELLRRPRKGEPPREGDELPELRKGWRAGNSIAENSTDDRQPPTRSK